MELALKVITESRMIRAGRLFPLVNGQIASIGRSTDREIFLSEPVVNRRHCEVSWWGTEVRVTDLGSRNGTRVNGISVTSGRATLIRPCDVIEVARTVELQLVVRVPIDPAWLRWNDGLVTRLARGIDEGRRFEDMPILHDALLDAGCDNQDILDHCKEPGPHVRGCWVLDLLLGKE
jgi:hypothetical protein